MLNVLITRQATKADNLIKQIRLMGGNSYCLPLFAIEPIFKKEYLQQLLSELPNNTLIICVSRNAAELLLPYLSELRNMQWAAIGPGTAQYLLDNGLKKVLFPSTAPYDSVSLMQVFKLSNINLENQYIILLTGENGDGWLQATLMQHRAKVEVLPLYKRTLPPISTDELVRILCGKPAIDIILITCVTSLVNLIGLAKEANIEILNKPLLVVSQRIYKYAIAQGFIQVYTAASMSESDILQALVNYRYVNAKIISHTCK